MRANATDEQILELVAQGITQREIERVLKVCRKRIRALTKAQGLPTRVKAVRSEENAFVEDSKGATASYTATVPITKEDLASKFDIDLEKWELIQFKVKTWEVARSKVCKQLSFDEGKITGQIDDTGRMEKVPMYSASGSYRLRKSYIDADLASKFRESLGKPKKRKVPKPVDTSSDVIEIALPDVHVGQRTLYAETGEVYTLDIAIAGVHKAIAELTEDLHDSPVSKIVLPIGNDFFNSDNMHGTTTSGTPQEEDGHWALTFTKGVECLVEVVDNLRCVADEVELLLVPGNHDYERSYYLAEALRFAFLKCDDVIVDSGINPQKVRLYHETLVAYHHGDKVTPANLASALPVQHPELWTKARWRRVHCGHIHRQKAEDLAGVTVQYFRCLTASSAWASKKAYTNIRAATRIRYRAGRGAFETTYSYCN